MTRDPQAEVCGSAMWTVCRGQGGECKRSLWGTCSNSYAAVREPLLPVEHKTAPKPSLRHDWSGSPLVLGGARLAFERLIPTAAPPPSISEAGYNNRAQLGVPPLLPQCFRPCGSVSALRRGAYIHREGTSSGSSRGCSLHGERQRERVADRQAPDDAYRKSCSGPRAAGCMAAMWSASA